MKRFCYSLAMFVLVAASFGQEIPDGVRYKKATPAVNEAFLKLLRTLFTTNDETVVKSGLSSSICGGPNFWSVCKKVGMTSGKPVTFVVPDTSTGASERREGRRWLTPGDELDAWKTVRALASVAPAVTVRRPKEAEIAYYWAIIPFDIEEPLFVVESEKMRLLVNGDGKGKVFFLELLPLEPKPDK